MKLVRFGQQGQEKPGILNVDGRICDLSGIVSKLTVDMLAVAKAADIVALL